jgi:cytidylate kinase
MPAKIITVAWTDGSRAESIARAIAERLNFRFISDEIIDRAAAAAGIDAEAMEAVEHRDSLGGRILRVLGSFQPAGLVGYTDVATDQTPAYRELLKEVVRQVAMEGSCVIGLHGAAVTLRGTPGLLRLFITASLETRIARVATANNVSESDARSRVEKTDADRRDFFQKFFSIEDERAYLYDLTINTDAITEEQALAAIMAVARS